jgi:hypothetical protein
MSERHAPADLISHGKSLSCPLYRADPRSCLCVITKTKIYALAKNRTSALQSDVNRLVDCTEMLTA